MANVSYLRSPTGGLAGRRSSRAARAGGRPTGPSPYLIGGVMVAVVAVVVAGVLILTSAHASLTADSTALAKVGMPLGGGSVESVTAYGGPHGAQIPVEVRGDRIWPLKRIPAGEQLKIYAVVKRPGWIAWLAGDTQRLHLTLTTPVASLRTHYLTLAAHQPLILHFKQPIREYASGPSGHLRRHVLNTPETTIELPRAAAAGSIFVSAAPRSWESSTQALVSWFPAGGAATVIANPAPGAKLTPSTPITLTFSKPIANVLGTHLPPVSAGAEGRWRALNSHELEFVPRGYGYGLGGGVHVALPSGVRLLGGQQGSAASGGTWTTPGGSTLRLQQLLATEGYLPLRFKYAQGPAAVSPTPAAEEAAAITPPAGRFIWRYRHVPAALHNMWQAGTSGEMTKGAVMAFENDHGMTADGVPGTAVWRALIGAALSGHRSTFGYTFVSVSEGSPETESTWHNGRTVESGLVNTGIAAAPTAQGVFAVFEHAPSVTMSGTNPDGSHYSDPGVPWVSYFNGGDALHGFSRAGYGFPQSLGCVEMPYGEAAAVYPFTPIGTIVDVT